jgi:hypothetical protein
MKNLYCTKTIQLLWSLMLISATMGTEFEFFNVERTLSVNFDRITMKKRMQGDQETPNPTLDAVVVVLSSETNSETFQLQFTGTATRFIPSAGGSSEVMEATLPSFLSVKQANAPDKSTNQATIPEGTILKLRVNEFLEQVTESETFSFQEYHQKASENPITLFLPEWIIVFHLANVTILSAANTEVLETSEEFHLDDFPRGDLVKIIRERERKEKESSRNSSLNSTSPVAHEVSSQTLSSPSSSPDSTGLDDGMNSLSSDRGQNGKETKEDRKLNNMKGFLEDLKKSFEESLDKAFVRLASHDEDFLLSSGHQTDNISHIQRVLY